MIPDEKIPWPGRTNKNHKPNNNKMVHSISDDFLGYEPRHSISETVSDEKCCLYRLPPVVCRDRYVEILRRRPPENKKEYVRPQPLPG